MALAPDPTPAPGRVERGNGDPFAGRSWRAPRPGEPGVGRDGGWGAGGDVAGDTDELPLAELAERDRHELEARAQPRRVPWPVVLAAVVLFVGPLVAAAAATGPVGALETLSVQLGVLACGLLVAVILIVSRFRRVSHSIGLPLLMAIHRHLGVLVVVVVLAHIAFAVAHNPRRLGLFDPLHTTTAARWAIASTVALLLLAVAFTAAGRGPRHNTRRLVHIVLGLVVVIGVGFHVVLLVRMVRTRVGVGWMLALVAVLGVALLARWVLPVARARGAYVVQGTRGEQGQVFTLSLVPRSPRARVEFRPGQFVWLRRRALPLGGEEHPFTIASSAEVPSRLELTIDRSGPYTAKLHTLHRGDRVWLDGPHGAFTGADTIDAGLVLVAGGAGITPMLSMLRTLADRGDTHPHALLFAQKDGQTLFEDELAWLDRRLDLRIEILRDRWIDPALVREVVPHGAEGDRGYYVSGPDALVESSITALTHIGVPAHLINVETY